MGLYRVLWGYNRGFYTGKENGSYYKIIRYIFGVVYWLFRGYIGLGFRV